MSLENAIRIFTEQGFSNPQWAVDIIQRAESLDKLKQIMIDERTSLSEDQFVNFRITSLYKGDPEFARRTLDVAKEKFGEYGLPEEIVSYYISHGGGVDISMALDGQMYLGKLPKVEERSKLLKFFSAAGEYLFETLRAYVRDS